MTSLPIPGSDFSEQLQLLANARRAYPRDFASTTETGLAVLAAVQAFLNDPAAAAAVAERWEQQFAIAEAWAAHRASVRRSWVPHLDGNVEDDLRQVDENWRRDPVQMLRNIRSGADKREADV